MSLLAGNHDLVTCETHLLLALLTTLRMFRKNDAVHFTKAENISVDLGRTIHREL